VEAAFSSGMAQSRKYSTPPQAGFSGRLETLPEETRPRRRCGPEKPHPLNEFC